VTRLLPLAAAALALVSAASGGGVATPSPATLLARHVPVLVLHPAERLAPAPVDGFLADSDLQRPTQAGWETVPGPLPAGGAEHRLDQRLCRAVDGPGATDCYVQAEAAHGAAPVVYGAAFRRGSRIELQYWLWYPYNPYSTGVPPGDFWQAHEGDWEAVGVVTDLRGRPLVAGYSQHGEGRRRAWARVRKQGAGPVVYVALGSHANYFSAGTHRFDPRVVEPLLIRIIEEAGLPPVDRTGRGRTLRPRLIRVSASAPSWMTFAGAWGEDQYLRAPGSLPQPFGGGPRGPAFHEQWRRPVAELLSWSRG